MPPYRTLPVPPRIQRLRAELFATAESICWERARIVTESYRGSAGEPSVIRRARALYDVFERLPLFIRPGELIVGQRASRLAARAVYPEYFLHDLPQDEIPPEVASHWRGHTLREIVKGRQPEAVRRAEAEMAAGYATGAASGFGHVIVDYPKAINVGFEAIIAEAHERLATCPEDDILGRDFLKAVIIAGKGIIRWAERYAELAEALAAGEPDPVRRAELARIAATCRRVPAQPARDFREALQSFWFAHLAMHIEQYGWSISTGRLDQYLWPYLERDLASNALTETEGWELVCSLWVKFMENVSARAKVTTFQNLTLGGQDADGRDCSNPLSYLCLDATVALKFNQPALSVRWHAAIAPAFWERVQAAIAQGTGMPALFNDEVIIAALIAHGVAPEHAVGYGIVGCVEACVPGQQQGLTAGGHINVAKSLELALNEGHSMLTGAQIGIATPPPETFRGWDDLWAAYVAQTEYLAGVNIAATWVNGEAQKEYVACPLMSSLLDDCLARRRDLVYGGTRYNLPGIAIYGPSNVYDGLMAIRQVVIEEGAVTFGELRRALLDDFQGQEVLRQRLIHTDHRFGNDDALVDALANQVNAVHADFSWKHIDPRNGHYTCGVWPVESHVFAGNWTAATPDGRHAGAPLVDGVGACQGADRKGPTALLRSVAKLDNVSHWPAGNTCNIKYSPASLELPGGLARLGDLNTTFMRLGGQELQINVVDAATLRAAQERPEEYADLLVRVAGFSAYFTQLSKATQDEILSRTTHAV